MNCLGFWTEVEMKTASDGFGRLRKWIHLVWSTKNRLPFLTDAIRPTVFQHIRENAKEKDIFLDFINGYREHVHSLIALGVDQTIAQIVKLIKGESSHWINSNGLLRTKFAWQREYFCVSVGESMLDATRNYIFGIRKLIIPGNLSQKNLI